MNAPIMIEGTIPIRRRRHNAGPEENEAGPAATSSLPPSRTLRIAQLMALARHVEELVRSGALASYAAAARLGHVSRARMSQIVSLINLAPDLQEQLLFLQRPARGRAAPVLRYVLQVAAALDWNEQRRRWRQLRPSHRQRRSKAP